MLLVVTASRGIGRGFSIALVFCFLDSGGWITLSSGAGTSPAKLVSLRNFRPQSRESGANFRDDSIGEELSDELPMFFAQC